MNTRLNLKPLLFIALFSLLFSISPVYSQWLHISTVNQMMVEQENRLNKQSADFLEVVKLSLMQSNSMLQEYQKQEKEAWLNDLKALQSENELLKKERNLLLIDKTLWRADQRDNLLLKGQVKSLTIQVQKLRESRLDSEKIIDVYIKDEKSRQLGVYFIIGGVGITVGIGLGVGFAIWVNNTFFK